LLGQRYFVGFDELHGDRVVAVDLATGWLGDLAPFGISGPGSVGALAGALLLWRARRLLLRVQRLAWTIADLVAHDVPGEDELAIALAMRRGEQPGAVRLEAVGP
jgi:hypothetical protein